MEIGVSKAANDATSSYSKLTQIKGVNREAIASLDSLNKVMSAFRGPSKAAAQNTSDLLTVLGRHSGIKFSSAGLSGFLGALSRFSGPTPQAGKNTDSLLKALSRFSGVTGAGSKLTSFLTALGSFRGPGAAAGANTTKLLNALSNFSGAPRGLDATANSFKKLVVELNAAAAAYGHMRSAAGGPLPSAPRGPAAPRGGGGGVGGAIRDQELLRNSILRTQTAFNTLGGILGAKLVIGAANDVLKLNAQLYAATGSTRQAADEMAYLQRKTQELGLDLLSTGKSYGLFIGSIKGSSISLAGARRIFEGFSTAGRALQLSNDDLDGVFRALGQIVSKGKLQAEELRGQLGDRLPGAVIRFANALGVVPSKLDAMLKKGEITGKVLDDALYKMADNLKTEFGPAAELASKTVDSAFNRMKNAFTNAASGLGQAGLNEGIIKIADSITKLINSQGLAQFLSLVGSLFKVAGDNIETFSLLLSTIAITSALKYVVGLKSIGAAMTALPAAQAAFSAALVSSRIAMTAMLIPLTGTVAASSAAGLALRGLVAASALASGAFAFLRVAMLAVPFVAIGAAVFGLLSYFSSLSSEANKAAAAVANINQTNSDGTNLLAAFAQNVDLSAGKLDKEADSLRKNTIERLANNAALIQNSPIGLSRYNAYAGDGKFGKAFGSVDSSGGSIGFKGNKVTDRGVLGAVGTVLQSDGGNDFNLVDSSTKEGYRKLLKFAGRAGAIKTGGGVSEQASADLLRSVEEKVAAAVALRRAQYSAGQLSFNPDDIEKDYKGGRAEAARRKAALTGTPTPPGTPKAAKKTAAERAAEAAAKADNADQRRAAETVRDINREFTSATASSKAFSSSLEDGFAAIANDSALQKVNNFLDSFAPDRVGANMVKFASNLKDVARETLSSADASDQAKAAATTFLATSTDSLDTAKNASVAYLGALQLAANQAKKNQEVEQALAETRLESAQRLGSYKNTFGSEEADAIVAGGNALRQYNAELAAEKQLLGTSTEYHDSHLKSITEEILKQQHLNDLVEQANRIHANNRAAQDSADSAGFYTSGARPQDIQNASSLVTLRNDLVDKGGFSADEINRLVEGQAATLRLVDAVKEIQDQYDAGRQAATDFADAIVGGFQKGGEQGDSFLKTMKNIFKDLQKTILDVVIYNPLRKFLTDALTPVATNLTVDSSQVGKVKGLAGLIGGNSGGSAGGAGALGAGGVSALAGLTTKAILDAAATTNAAVTTAGAQTTTAVSNASTGTNALLQTANGYLATIAAKSDISSEAAQDTAKVFNNAATDVSIPYQNKSGFGGPTDGSSGVNPDGTSYGYNSNGLLSLIDQLPKDGNYSNSTSSSSPGGINLPAFAAAVTSGTKPALEEVGTLLVSNSNKTAALPEAIALANTKPKVLSPLKKLFDYKTNSTNLFGKGFSDKIVGVNQSIGKALNGVGAKLGINLGGIAKTVGTVGKAAGAAFAAYSAGAGIAKALGLGKVGQSVAGGAAAGAQLGGPVGAVIGGVLGLAKGLLFKKKPPSTQSTVTVDEYGTATAGAAVTANGGSAKLGKALGTQGAKIFNTFVDTFGGKLTAGNFGTFGNAKFKGDDNNYFYSLSGSTKKGKPTGTYGVDYINGTESEVNAFALKAQINSGKIAGVSQTLRTVAANSQATSVEDLNSDFNVGKAFDDYIKSSFQTSSVAKQISDLTDNFAALKRQAVALGLSADALDKSLARNLETIKNSFNFDISQGILGITDPIQADYNQLVKNYKDSVSDAIASGGDINKVEEYYGLQRTELIKKYLAQGTNAIRTAAQNLYDQLTTTTASPLDATTVFRNAQSKYQALQGELSSGNYTHIDDLSNTTSAYLDSAQALYASSSDYFGVFSQVTEFLKNFSTTASGTTTDPNSLPELPALNSLVAEIKAGNDAQVAATNNVANTVVSANGALLSGLSDILAGASYNPSTGQLTFTTPNGTGGSVSRSSTLQTSVRLL